MKGVDSRFVFFVVIAAALCVMAFMAAGAMKFYEKAFRPLLDAFSAKGF